MYCNVGSISVSGQLPTYPFPNPTLTLTCYQLTVVGLVTDDFFVFIFFCFSFFFFFVFCFVHLSFVCFLKAWQKVSIILMD